MDIGMIGMGRMGGNMAERIRQGDHRVVGYDRDPDTRSSVRFGANVRGDATISYAWSFGDGTTDNGAAPIHTYDRPGNYTVSLSVSNTVGAAPSVPK